ncbi:sulfite oxidase [Mesobacillus jeotgali]|uniref:Sulfite oxidase n=1 Tax=Mesobacillus jeotgali TaxID=129985 RepID=A0ABY9VBS0_9BACI|nr:sulfite oxidase [Mesobacillus jeotgali]WNF21342.1 sulfite oxidase [Mesobacillus jeotgali]
MYLDYRKVRPYLTTKSLSPENQETPIHFISLLQPVADQLFYRRNHFSYPILTPESFTLKISGSVDQALQIHYSEIIMLPSNSYRVLIECAGNKRAYFKEKVFGEQWEDGAMSEGIWKGVPLKTFLEYTGMEEGVTEVVFRGRDSGIKNGQYVHFERSLPIEMALHPEVMIAFEYNGKPISHKHGYPFRLIVPGWYGMASVKWLTEIFLVKNKFTGPFQTDDYVYYFKNSTSEPVTTNKVNSTIQKPLDRQLVKSGTQEISGIAWTGSGVISKVEISFDHGANWEQANFDTPTEENQTVSWSYMKEFKSGNVYHITVRATDSEGKTQPADAIWNKKGYGYHAAMVITVKAE